jgi:dihydrofolate reductase
MINAIFAVDINGGMGYNGTLPWPHNQEDMTNFYKTTANNVVVMGRRTWDDPKMPKPLQDRIVYVATNRSVNYATAISGDLNQQLLSIEQTHPNKQIFVIGGVKLLETAKPLFDRVYISYFKGSFRHDVRINVKEFLVGFKPRRATVSKDCASTFTVYESIFKRADQIS